MDKITVKNLEVFAKHGVLQAEKELPQKFIVSCELGVNLSGSHLDDDIGKTINYADVCRDIAGFMANNTFNLIETCAGFLADYILQNYPAESAAITIEKPQAPIGMQAAVSVQIHRAWHTAYLGLGSNMGDKKANLDGAIKEMQCPDLRVLRASNYHITKPVSPVPQDDFLNCVLEVKTTLTPRSLMSSLLKTEEKLGRRREQPLGPRAIDIDILTYDNIISDCPLSVIPHPQMHKRLFVLVPFCELNPHFVHPLLGRRVGDLKAELQENEGEM